MSPPPGSDGPDGQRGASVEASGDVAAVTPLTTNQPPTMNHHHNGSGWVFHRSLSEEERTTAAQLLDGISQEVGQALLDELYGRIAAGSIRSSRMGYLRSLVGRAKEGTFVPELALTVAARREQRQCQKQSVPVPVKLASREVVEEHLKKIRRVVGRGVRHA